jgi:hypothetical protein
LIVCEGKETEWNYFNQLRLQLHDNDQMRRRSGITVKRGRGGSRQQIARFAVERKDNANERFDEVWCVMDVEHPNDLDDMRAALTLLESNQIQAALSNPAFEVWFLAHFDKTGTAFSHCDAVVARLNKHWQEYFSADYDKADGQIYCRLADRLRDAVANAKWVREEHHSGRGVVDSNSSTDVDLLVGKLLGK